MPAFIPTIKSKASDQVTLPSPLSASKETLSVKIQFALVSQIKPVRLSVSVPSLLFVKRGEEGTTPLFVTSRHHQYGLDMFDLF